MLVDHIPEPAMVGVVGHALEDHLRRAVEQRAVDDIAVPRDPADIGGAPEHLARLVVEDIVEGGRGPDAVAAGGVEHALGLARRTRGVEDEQRILGAHFLAGAVRVAGEFVQPAVARRLHRGLGAGVADHQHPVDSDALMRQRGVDIGFERHRSAAAHSAIGGDDETALAIDDPPRQRLGREAAEHHRMHRAQPRTGEHGGDALDDHRHVERDAVAPGDAQRFQRIGHPHDLAMQLAIGEAAGLAGGIVGFEDQRGAVALVRQMAVDRIVAQVERAIAEPFDEHRVVGPFAALHRRGEPVEPLGLFEPEGVGLFERAAVERLILLGRAMSCAVGARGLDEFAHDHSLLGDEHSGWRARRKPERRAFS